MQFAIVKQLAKKLTAARAVDAGARRDVPRRALSGLGDFAKVIYYLESSYYDPAQVEQKTLIGHALQGMVRKLDPHTVIMPREAFQQLTMGTQGKFGGVGIIVSRERERLIVISAIEDTPAAKAGIKSGDHAPHAPSRQPNRIEVS